MFYVVDKRIVDKNTLLQVLDTSDGVAEWYSYNNVMSIIQQSNIAVFGVKPLKAYPQTSGVFNKHVASIILGRGLKYLCSIKDFSPGVLGFATETLSNGEYGFECFEYNGVVWSGIMSQNMCSIGYDVIVKSTDKLQHVDLPKCLTIASETMLHIEVSPDAILHFHIGEPVDECEELAEAKYLIENCM